MFENIFKELIFKKKLILISIRGGIKPTKNIFTSSGIQNGPFFFIPIHLRVNSSDCKLSQHKRILSFEKDMINRLMLKFGSLCCPVQGQIFFLFFLFLFYVLVSFKFGNIFLIELL